MHLQKNDGAILNTYANCWLLSASAGDCTGSLRLTDYLLNTKLPLSDLGTHVGADALCLCVHNIQYSFFVIVLTLSISEIFEC